MAAMFGDLADYLVDNGERELRVRLLTDYKEGKVYSYFDSKWLREVFYHELIIDSDFCFVKTYCSPSKNISNDAHKI